MLATSVLAATRGGPRASPVLAIARRTKGRKESPAAVHARVWCERSDERPEPTVPAAIGALAARWSAWRPVATAVGALPSVPAASAGLRSLRPGLRQQPGQTKVDELDRPPAAVRVTQRRLLLLALPRIRRVQRVDEHHIPWLDVVVNDSSAVEVSEGGLRELRFELTLVSRLRQRGVGSDPTVLTRHC